MERIISPEPVRNPSRFRMRFIIYKTHGDGGDNDETSTLTDSPPKSEGHYAGVLLRVISQEPLGIEFHWIGVGSRVV